MFSESTVSSLSTMANLSKYWSSEVAEVKEDVPVSGGTGVGKMGDKHVKKRKMGDQTCEEEEDGSEDRWPDRDPAQEDAW